MFFIPPVFPQLFSISFPTKKLNMSSGKGHNTWLTKFLMFGETIAEHGRLYMFFAPKIINNNYKLKQTSDYTESSQHP